MRLAFPGGGLRKRVLARTMASRGFSGLLGASRGFTGLLGASRGFTGLAEAWCRVGSLVGILRRPSGCGQGRELSGWNSPGASGRLADYGVAIP